MKILIIGGGVFVGRAMTDALLDAGHSVTHFNRGKRSTPRRDVETVIGDRMESLDRLRGRTFDAVVDTCAYVPRAVELSTSALAESAGRYLFVSTLSVYDYDAGVRGARIDESWPRAVLPPESDRDVMTPETYGALKALCEDVAFERYGSRATSIRCGLMVGPHDGSNRFTYWVTRVARGGRMLAPVGPDSPMQFIDVRDVARFTVHALERDLDGAFNVTGRPASCDAGRRSSCRVCG